MRHGDQKGPIERSAEEVGKLRSDPDQTKSRKKATKPTKMSQIFNPKVKL